MSYNSFLTANELLSIQVVSAILLYLALILGMIARVIFDQTRNGRKLTIKAWKILHPLMASPVVFLAFLGILYIPGKSVGINITTALLAFQIGFTWEKLFEKKREYPA